MKDNQNNNGFQTVAMILQMVCLIVFIVLFSLMLNLFGRSMLSFRDIGNDSFFHSSYYMNVLTKETNGLTTYLRLRGGIRQNDLDYEKYKQYKLKFDNGDSNLYYWFAQGDQVLTNMEQKYDQKAALKHAKHLGSYFYYDDETITFQGNIRYLDRTLDIDVLRLFQQLRQSGGLIVAVDTALPKQDAIAEAADIYDTYFSWVEISFFVIIIAVMCFVLCIIYLTLSTGKNGEDGDMRLYRMDYIPTELLFLFFVLFVAALVAFCARLGGQSWDIASSLILTGTLVFLSDVILLTLYLSFVRKIKADIFISCSLTAHIVHLLKECMRRQRIVKRSVIQFVLLIVWSLFFAWWAFSKRNIYAYIGLLLVLLYLATYFLQQALQRSKILEGIHEIRGGNLNYKYHASDFSGDYMELAEELNGVGEGLSHAVEENVKNERLKTELITNVSHDIKTPLTSIINYIELIKMEGIENGNLKNYVGILEQKSQRLKQLTEDLVEVSRITSGNITLDMQPINMVELICQTGGEFNEIFEDMGLTIITRLPKEPVMILADGSRIWRVIQNLYNNVAKYALKDTRVYVELRENDGVAEFSIKDISAQEIQKMPQDLSERFVRGDESRGTEGSGLGLSIARNLTNMMGGTFEITLDGDLFTASITFPVINP